MDINRTSGERVSASQRDFVTALSNQATIRKPCRSLAAVAFGLLLSVSGLAQAQYRFSTIDVPNATRTAANGNSTHEIAGEFDDAHGHTHGFVLNKGVFTTIDAPGAVASVVNGINAPDRLGGAFLDSMGKFHAFFENKGGFITLDPPGSIRTLGGFINAQGQVDGTYRDATEKRHGFIWSNGAFTPFNVPGDHPLFGTVALGINDNGEVVGDYVFDTDHQKKNPDRHGFLRSSNGGFTRFDVPGTNVPGTNVTTTIGEGINNTGTIVGAYAADNKSHGFVLNNGVVFTTVNVPDPRSGKAQETEINSINTNGEIVGFYNDSKGVQHGFLGVPAP
jgi:uncharacterized membrane protein